jgi:hypothetical protein
MCEFLKNLFGGGSTGAAEALMRGQLEETRRANDLATEQARVAQQQAAAALANPADSESARRAGERRMRRLVGEPLLAPLAAPPVSYKVLMGT